VPLAFYSELVVRLALRNLVAFSLPMPGKVCSVAYGILIQRLNLWLILGANGSLTPSALSTLFVALSDKIWHRHLKPFIGGGRKTWQKNLVEKQRASDVAIRCSRLVPSPEYSPNHFDDAYCSTG
jgi:hypothetical protein